MSLLREGGSKKKLLDKKDRSLSQVFPPPSFHHSSSNSNQSQTTSALNLPPPSFSMLQHASSSSTLSSSKINSGPKHTLVSPRKRSNSQNEDIIKDNEPFSALKPKPPPVPPRRGTGSMSNNLQVPVFPPIPPPKRKSDGENTNAEMTTNDRNRGGGAVVAPIVLFPTMRAKKTLPVQSEIIELLRDKFPWFESNWESLDNNVKLEVSELIINIISKNQPAGRHEVIESKKIQQSQIANFEYDKAAAILEIIKMIKAIKAYVDLVYKVVNLESDLSPIPNAVKLCFSNIQIVLKSFGLNQLEVTGKKTFELLESSPNHGKPDDELIGSLGVERLSVITYISNKYAKKIERIAVGIRSCLTCFVSIIWDSKRQIEKSINESDQLLLDSSGHRLVELILALLDDVYTYHGIINQRKMCKITTEDVDNSVLEEDYDDNISDGYITVNRLIRALMAESSSTHFKKSFINTYQSFTTSWCLYQKLIQLYNYANDNPTYKTRVLVILKYWIEASFIDFDGQILKMLKGFIANQISMDNPESAQTLMSSVVEKAKQFQINSEDTLSLSPLSYFVDTDGTYDHCIDTIMQHEPIVVAQQLTLIDWEIFKELEISGLINTAWTSPTKKYKAINVISLITRVNQLSYWVASNIVVLPTPQQRHKLFKRFLAIAEELKNMNNFLSLAGIVVGFNLACIVRLKQTKALLRQKHVKQLQDFNFLFDPSGSYKNYRAHVYRILPPLIPYIGVCLSDVTLIDEGNLDYVGGYINFQKHELIYDSVKDINNYRVMLYNIQKNEILYNYLQALPAFDEDQLFDISLLREPRQQQH